MLKITLPHIGSSDKFKLLLVDDDQNITDVTNKLVITDIKIELSANEPCKAILTCINVEADCEVLERFVTFVNKDQEQENV